MRKDTLSACFADPPAAFRGKPFWSWNGRLEKDELLRQIHILQEMGMGGYFCHSRTGLETEYLGEEWFELIRACAEKGDDLGMETWLYDEDRWPSATAGGMVTKDPANRIKYIRLNIGTAEDFSFTDTVIAAFSADVEGLAFRNKRRLRPETFSADGAEGNRILWFEIEEMGASSFYNGYTYADTMRRETTEEFIRLTHERYREECGDSFGSKIKGIFTDEPHRGAVMSGFQLNNRQGGYLTPYTEKLFDLFLDDYGYDLRDFLPELFLQKDGEAVSPVKWQYINLIQRLFLENYLTPLADWCHQNDMLLTGHLLQEDSLTSQTDMIGSVMRGYELMDYPGIDILTKGNFNYKVAKQLQSVGRQLNKPWLLSELYGCTGWEYTFADHKYMGDWQALLGINLRCHHLSWYTMEGEAKRDYPASINYQSSWYKDYHYVEEYFARLAAVLKEGDPCCEVLVVHPVESAWSVIHAEWSTLLSTNQPDVLGIETDFKAMCQMLLDHQVDFDYGDEDMLARLGSVKMQDGVPVLQLGCATYKTVVLGSMLTMRGSTLRLLREFIACGGRVIQSGREADYVDALRSQEVHDLPLTRVPFTEEAFIPLLDRHRLVRIADPITGKDTTRVFAQVRKNADQSVVMLLNTDKANGRDLMVAVDFEGYMEEWDARSGEQWYLGYHRSGEAVSLTLDKAEEKILVFNTKRGETPPKPLRQPLRTASALDEFPYTLAEPNVCVLDIARYRVDDGEWSDPTEILRVDRGLRERYGLAYRTGVMLQPWFTKGKEHPCLGKVTLQFAFTLQTDVPVMLGIERPERYRITLNGHEISNRPIGWWADKSIQTLPLPSEFLKCGENVLECHFDFCENVGTEALYLLGDFGVSLEGLTRTLTPLPATLHIGDLREQGFPFYGAGVRYRLSDLPRLGKGEKLYLKTEDFAAACIRISNQNGHAIIAYHPYEADITPLLADGCDFVEVEYVLTRRNTFGPLHIQPTVLNSYNPTVFVTKGDSFREDGYSLIPQGMLQPLQLLVVSEDSSRYSV